MSGMAVAQRMTVAEFLETDAPRFTTLIEGEVVVHAPRGRHQRVALDLSFALESWRRAEPGRGEVWMALGVALDDHNYYEPDLLWYSAGRERGRTEDTLHPLPDIAVEIRSPSTWRYDIGVKKARYEEHGLAELWLVDTAADEVIVFRRSRPKAPTFDVSAELARGDALTSPSLPGFAMALDELFGPLTA